MTHVLKIEVEKLTISFVSIHQHNAVDLREITIGKAHLCMDIFGFIKTLNILGG
jgi:hypothetical protein